MFKRVSKFDWQQGEDVRLRVARLRATVKSGHERAGPVSRSRALSRRPAGTSRYFPSISAWLKRLLTAGRRRRG